MALFGLINSQRRFEKAADTYNSQVAAIVALEKEMAGLDDAALQERVTKHKESSVSELKKNLPEIFAAVREAGWRTLEMKHFEVQLKGGLALLDGSIAEMRTGEGKTLVATLPLIFHALTGKGAHLVTVNDYLAERDSAWMRPLYEFFDLTVGVSVPGMSSEEKREAYAADITYGTNNEFGFDYLRDNMAQTEDELVQRGLAYALIDEVDSILIDEARTPLIISAPDSESTQLYAQFARIVPQLKLDTHYTVDEKRKTVLLTDEGVSRVEELLSIDNLYADKGVRFVHHLEQGLRAHAVYQKDKEYVVKDGQVMIVDEFTGRLMEGRRYSEGLHQAIEAKEGVTVQQESRTLATITFQNLFRLYDSLSGMTGTAVTSAEEFETVYNLDVVVMPTNKKLVRNDRPDKIFANEQAKFRAVVNEIKKRHEQGQPVLVGTIAIEKSEYLSALLQREGVSHEVLNAKHHAREAEIITNAGQRGAVTISTNMAGRGTDIKLGDGVADLGGLFVLGTERHEARRIDNQLRGRSGRQGDAGETQFFVSMEDDVMRIFGGEKIKSLMDRLKLPEDEPIENRLVTRALTGAQERVEGYYFDMRKQVLSYDDVLNRQRTAIYTLRRGVMTDAVWRDTEGEEELHDHLLVLIQEQAEALVQAHTGGDHQEEWEPEEIAEATAALVGQEEDDVKRELEKVIEDNWPDGPERTREAVMKRVTDTAQQVLNKRQETFGEAVMDELERTATMRSIDTHWMDHLDTMDYLRTGIGLRGYGQRDPLVEYQKEGYQLFQNLLGTITSSILEVVMRAQPAYADSSAPTIGGPEAVLSGGKEGSSLHQLAEGQLPQPSQPEAKTESAENTGPLKKEHKGVGRNDPCPCGSGKKFKKCGMINAPEHTATA